MLLSNNWGRLILIGLCLYLGYLKFGDEIKLDEMVAIMRQWWFDVQSIPMEKGTPIDG